MFLKCGKCGEPFPQIVRNLLSGNGGKGTWCKCNKGGRPSSMNIDMVREHLEAMKYTLLSSEYKNNKTPILYRCDRGHEHPTDWMHLERGQSCPDCAKNRTLTLEILREKLEETEPEGFPPDVIISPPEELVDGKSTIRVKCSRCEKEYQIKASKLSDGDRCSKCKYIRGWISRKNKKNV